VLKQFCDWLSNTSISLAFQNWSWFVPIVQTIHILGIAVVLFSVYTISFRLMGVTRARQPLAVMTGKSMPWTWAALTVLLVTGLLLTITEPARELLNNAFRAKMVLVMVLVGVLLLIQARLRSNPEYWTESPRRRRHGLALGVIALLIGACIVTAGRWIAYV
jgi:hypothetical protein